MNTTTQTEMSDVNVKKDIDITIDNQQRSLVNTENVQRLSPLSGSTSDLASQREKVAVIYVININNSPRYIGKTIKDRISRRLTEHKRDAYKYDHHMARLMRKSIENNSVITIEVLEECSYSKWEDCEKFWISHYKTNNIKLANQTEGGLTNEFVRQSYESQKKKSRKLKGRKRPQNVRNKISKSHKGKKLSNETKRKLREVNLGKFYAFETKLKTSKPVVQLKNDVVIDVFYSMSEASRCTKVSKGAISNVCSGQQKSAGGFQWQRYSLNSVEIQRALITKYGKVISQHI